MVLHPRSLFSLGGGLLDQNTVTSVTGPHGDTHLTTTACLGRRKGSRKRRGEEERGRKKEKET